MTKPSTVISLYDYTGEALRPWAKAGHKCYAYDIQHENIWHSGEVEHFDSDGVIYKCHADLYKEEPRLLILARHGVGRVAFLSAFPPCTDLSGAGARWWTKKAAANPDFQKAAVSHLVACSLLARSLDCPYYIENPVGAVPRLWRSPDFRFDPYQFGGYLPEGDTHPVYPDIIPPRDAYRKRTCLWTGNGFRMPEPKPVDYENVVLNRIDPKKGHNYSPVHANTGGKSERTKNIRSATPRGFARAVYGANNPQNEKDY